jgi:hypothetical protein
MYHFHGMYRRSSPVTIAALLCFPHAALLQPASTQPSSIAPSSIVTVYSSDPDFGSPG